MIGRTNCMVGGKKVGSLVLFDGTNGGDVVSVTGGWDKQSTSYANYDTTQMWVYADNSRGWLKTHNTIDLTKYRTLHINVVSKSTQSYRLQVLNASDGLLKQEDITVSSGEFAIDINALTRSACKVRITAMQSAAGQRIVVNKVWLDNALLE